MINGVVIAGGGAAGWMAAAYLKRAFPKLPSITVIESPAIGAVGVGEASFSTFKLYWDFLGVKETEWMPACNATYKLGVKFVDWTRERGFFYHPFQRFEVLKGFDSAEWWLKLRPCANFDQACFVTPLLCETNRSPRYLDGTVFDQKIQDYFTEGTDSNSSLTHHSAQYPYGYHFDALLLAEYLKKYSIRAGVEHVADDIVGVEVTDGGAIASLDTRMHGRITGDLFIDCTGFRSLLLGGALREPFVGFSDSLPNDCAVAIQVPREPGSADVNPYTTATALSAGWAWKTPLYGRDGCGYVYSSRYSDPERAEAELRASLGAASASCPARHIRMNVGRRRNAWVGNCVGIGLSTAFVEPLESTGIFMIQHGIEELVRHFPGSPEMNAANVMSYNKVFAECIDGVREFLTIHFCATDRTDTAYWRDMKSLDLPGPLAERMTMFSAKLPSARSIYQPYHGFEAYSWSVILLGMNYLPPRHLEVLDGMDDKEAMEMFSLNQRRAAHLAATLPSHKQYLEWQRAMAGMSQGAPDAL